MWVTRQRVQSTVHVLVTTIEGTRAAIRAAMIGAVTPGTKMWMDLRPGAAWDPDASRSAAVLAAYFRFEEARGARRRVCRTAAVIALLTFAAQALFPLVDATSFATVLTGLATVAGGAVVLEWRAEKKLEVLMPRG
jgi:hypothetical protein